MAVYIYTHTYIQGRVEEWCRILSSFNVNKRNETLTDWYIKQLFNQINIPCSEKHISSLPSCENNTIASV